MNPRFTVPTALLEQIRLLENNSSIIKKKALLYAICDLLDENTQYTKKEQEDAALLWKIFDFVETNYSSGCSLAKISQVLRYNSSHISRYFKSLTGMTYVSFINQYKISKACDLLTNTNKTILECSLDCGYSSLRNFNRNFKTYIGVTPKEYRESGRRQNA